MDLKRDGGAENNSQNKPTIEIRKRQRTGLTEGTLIFNEWLKQFGLYREKTEDEFINWLFSSAGWYDKDIRGRYFDIDVGQARESDNYQRFLREFRDSLRGSEILHLMLHSSYHLHGLDKIVQFADELSPNASYYDYWSDPAVLEPHIPEGKILIANSFAPLIAEKYNNKKYNNKKYGGKEYGWDITPYATPQTHFNTGPDKDSWETLDRMTDDILKMDFDIALVSCGPYGCLLVDRLYKEGKWAMTVGSGLKTLMPVDVPDGYKPEGYMQIEDGRYWR